MEQQVYTLRGDGPGLLARHQQSAGPPVLYVHGATFPSALSVAYRFKGRSWMDDWNARSFDTWAFDFAGFGGSDRYSDDVEAMPSRAPDTAAQIARVVSHIASVTGQSSIAVVCGCGRLPKGDGMIAVIFEVWPNERAAYLDIAASLRPLLDGVDGFISIERFQSLTDGAKLLSLSFWRDEDAVAAWRNTAEHRAAQAAGRDGILRDYRLRIGSIVRDYGMTDRRHAPADSRIANDAPSRSPNTL
jgi:heme-degrading monooxygenase HmoA